MEGLRGYSAKILIRIGCLRPEQADGKRQEHNDEATLGVQHLKPAE
jgi:hypothetical protein